MKNRLKKIRDEIVANKAEFIIAGVYFLVVGLVISNLETKKLLDFERKQGYNMIDTLVEMGLYEKVIEYTRVKDILGLSQIIHLV